MLLTTVIHGFFVWVRARIALVVEKRLVFCFNLEFLDLVCEPLWFHFKEVNIWALVHDL